MIAPVALIAAAIALAAMALPSVAWGAETDRMPGDSGAQIAPQEATGDIVETAAAAGDFTTLLAAAEAAGLVETLQGDGPFTVFAPTDAAFAALPAGTVEGLLADPEALAEVLLYHVVSGEVLAEDVVGLSSATTVQGSDVSIAVRNGGVVLNDSVNVVATDVMATNGVIHVIDGVLLPPAEHTDNGTPAPSVAGNAGLVGADGGANTMAWMLLGALAVGLLGAGAVAVRVRAR